MTALIPDTAQLLIFLQGVDRCDFCISEELLDMKSLKSTTRGKDLFEAILCAIENMNLIWAKLCGISMDGAPAMIVKWNGMVCNKV